MATVCARLFGVAGPCRAYFGETDFQQVAVVRSLVYDLDLPVEVVACPTVRELDGLALVPQRPAERGGAGRGPGPAPGAAAGVDLVAAGGERDPEAIAAAVAEEVRREPRLRLDRVDVVDAKTLEPPGEDTARLRILAAAFLGRVRLIDNLAVVI